MKRSELIQHLAARFPQLTIADAEMVTKTIIDCISDHLASGGRVELRGFGSFSVNHRPARIGRNPMTGEQVQVPAKAAPHFKPGKELKELVNG